jgi:hypothetical protein
MAHWFLELWEQTKKVECFSFWAGDIYSRYFILRSNHPLPHHPGAAEWL